jgi:hypothetical protein
MLRRPTMPHRQDPLTAERRARQAVESIAQRAVGMWWNAKRFEPELAADVKAKAPRLVEALEELAELVMPKGVSEG